MADELITQIGVGGIFAVVVIREVFTFMKSQKMRMNGESRLSRKEFEEHKKSVQYKDNCEATHAAIAQRFSDMEKRDDDNRKFVGQRFNGVDQQLHEVKNMIGRLK
jgi:hypothetical protein